MSKLLAAWVVVLFLIGTMMLSTQLASASNGATFDLDLYRTSPNLSPDKNDIIASAARPRDSGSVQFGPGNPRKQIRAWTVTPEAGERTASADGSIDPVIITTGSAGTATQLEPQRAIWQNPRGLKYFYTIVQEGGTSGLRLYKSADGSTWSLVSQLAGTGTGYSTTYSASAYPYDDGTRLIVYVCYSAGGYWSSGKNVYYRRLLITDASSDPTIGAEQNTGKQGVHCNIARDRNGYVHIVMWGDGGTRDKVAIFGTTAANPGDSQTWSSTATIIGHGGSTATDDTSTIAVFGGTGNILGVVGQRRAATPNILYGVDIGGFNGASYTGIGAGTTIESGSNSYHPLDVAVDSNNFAHFVFHDAASTWCTWCTGLRYTKATAANTVQSWNAVTNADSTAANTVALSIDKGVTPNTLYVFYGKGTGDTIYYRTRSVDGSSWSAESTITDGTTGENLDWFQAGRELQQWVTPLMYTTQTSFKVRFLKFTGTGTIVVSPDPKTVTAGESVTYTAVAYDAYGNSLGEVTTSTSWSIESGAGGSWSVNVYTSEKAGTWTVTGTYSDKADAATLTVNAASLDRFGFGPISSPQTAGSAFSITVTAKDQYENTVTSYTGANILSDSTGTIGPTSTGAFTGGSWTGSVTITKAQTGVTITTIGNSKTGTSNSFSVNPASGNKLVITVNPSSVTAGSWTTVYTVQRQDQYGNPVASGSTTVNLASSSTGPAGKFSESAGGPSVTSVTIPDGASTKDFYYYDEKAGSWTISVSATGLTGDSKSLTVNPGSMASFTMSGYPSSVTAGQSFGTNNVVVTAYDAYNNVKTDYTGQVYFTSSDSQAVLPYTSASKYVFTTGDNGQHTFAGTSFTLKTAGSQTITVTDGAVSKTSNSITVNVGGLDHFGLSGYPSSVTAGQNFDGNNVVVTAYDAYGNVKTDYVGQVWFTSSDLQAVLPYTPSSKYTFTTGDNGVHTFAGTGFTLKTVGSQTITVTDGTVSLTSFPITVSPATVSITITSDPTGSGFVKVDSSSIITPQTFMWVVGSTHDLEALSPVSGGSGIQYVWTSWSDGGGQSHTYTTPSSPQTVTANYGTHEEIVTSTDSGTAYFDTNTGVLSDLSAVNEASLPAAGRPNLIFPHGFFSFTITDLTPGGTASVTITLPSAVPVGTQYWKYGPTPTDPTNHWYQLPMGDDDGDNMITITLVDGGLGDDDLTLDGVIIDQGGPANPPSRPVGGVLTPVDKLAVLAPYLALVGAIAAAVVMSRKKLRELGS